MYGRRKMPLVLLNRDPKVIDDGTAVSIGFRITHAVAAALHVEEDPNAHLAAEEIEVLVRDVRHDLDICHLPLAITIFANDYPARKANLDERRGQIEDDLRGYLGAMGKEYSKTILGKQKAFVWILLAPASFGFL